ncbi:MAG: type II toxin-antitoxin system VapC family toxin [Clostridia bacterium]|nr:type II toxin-antitoxin system VapC family toxin [Clostridia bacterium]
MIVVDASVAAKWYVPESGSDRAAVVLSSVERRVAPDLLAVELASVLWKKARRGELEKAEAKEILDAFLASGPVELLPFLPYLSAATDLALAAGCTVYDGLYIAVAVAVEGRLVTADARLAELAGRAGFGRYVTVL